MSNVDERNARTILDHSVETRRQNDELRQRVVAIEAAMVMQQQMVANLNAQVGFLRAQVLNGGPTSADHD